MLVVAINHSFGDDSSFVLRDRCAGCVFRAIVTDRFGIVTADFGNVTGHFGDVTD